MDIDGSWFCFDSNSIALCDDDRIVFADHLFVMPI